MADDKQLPADETQKQLKELEQKLADSKEAVEPGKTTKATSTPKNPRSSSKTVESKPKGNGLLWFVTVINFLLLFSAVGAGYWVWLQWNSQQAEQQRFVIEQKTTLSQQSRENSQIKQGLEKQNQSLEKEVKNLTGELKRLAQQSAANEQNLADVSGRRPSDWLLAEADYLVRMAGRKLWLEKDLRTAILMLQSADSRLQDLADPSLLPVRQLIATDIQNLQQINPVSLSSVALALSGMLPQINNLPLALPEIPDINSMDEEASESIGDWEQNLGKFWTFFKEELINYQPREGAIRPMLSAQQQWLAKEQLKLALLQAQSAVLNEQSTLYQQSLQRALGLLVDHFDLQNTKVVQFVDALRNVAETDISRILPSELQSARPLQDLLQKRVDNVFSGRVTEL